MRVVLVGPSAATRALRVTLEAAGVVVAGEVVSPEDVPDDEPHDAVVLVSAEREEVDADDDRPPVEALTAREREVLELVSQGLPNKAVASRLGLSDHTVKFHLSSIFSKLGVSTRTEAVRRAVRAGLITF